MNEAPKKIWVDELFKAQEEKILANDIPYIRADLVDGLVEALEEAVAGMGGSYAIWSITAKAALKALEEE